MGTRAEQGSFDEKGLAQPRVWGRGRAGAQGARGGEGGSSKSQQQTTHRDYKESKRIDLICVFTTQLLSGALSAPACNRWAPEEAEERSETDVVEQICIPTTGSSCVSSLLAPKDTGQWEMAPSGGLVTHAAPSTGLSLGHCSCVPPRGKELHQLPTKAGF